MASTQSSIGTGSGNLRPAPAPAPKDDTVHVDTSLRGNAFSLPMRKVITPEMVTSLYELRNQVNQCREVSEVVALAASRGISLVSSSGGTIGESLMGCDLRKAGKILLESFLLQSYPHASTLDEHARGIRDAEQRICNYLRSQGSRSGVLGFGSHAIGRINSYLSDFDGIIVLPADPREATIMRGLTEAGIVFSDKLTHFEDLDKIAETGRGLARLYGMSEQGIETEFHVLGAESFRNLASISPGHVLRVRPVDDKMELRVSLTGEKRFLPKPGDRVSNFGKHDGQVFRGFFNDALLKSVIVYDGTETLAQTCSLIRQRNIGAVLYHNDHLSPLPSGRVAVIADKLDFSVVRGTFFSSEPEQFAPWRLNQLSEQFERDVGDMCDRHRLVVSRRRESTPRGSGIDIATDKLHAARVHGVELIGADFDGTLFDGAKMNYGQVANLIDLVASHGKIMAIITAREATIKKNLLPLVMERLKKSASLSPFPLYLGVANGATLFEISGGSIQALYRNEIRVQDALAVASIYKSLFDKVVPPWVAENMRSDADVLKDAIPEPYRDITLQHSGVWAEPSKLTIAVPESAATDVPEFVRFFASQLRGSRFNVKWGGQSVVDITPKFTTDEKRNPTGDSKLHAMQYLMTYVGSTDERAIVTFGDTPNGNDAGLLSFTNSFTNRSDRLPIGADLSKPPYVLAGNSCSEVEKVHRAIRFLIK